MRLERHAQDVRSCPCGGGKGLLGDWSSLTTIHDLLSTILLFIYWRELSGSVALHLWTPRVNIASGCDRPTFS